jgi:K+-transporting ATPase KdpF subunit
MLMNLLLMAARGDYHVVREITLIVICVLVCVYLFVALLWPEKF